MEAKTKKIIGITVAVAAVAVGLCVVVSGTMVAVAYFTSSNVPVATTLVESVEKRLKEPENSTEKAIDLVSSEFVDELEKSTTDEGWTQEEVMQFMQDLSEMPEFKELVEEENTAAKIEYDYKFTLESDEMDGSLEMNGYVNRDLETEDLSGSMDIDGDASVVSISEELEFAYDKSGELVYFNIDGDASKMFRSNMVDEASYYTDDTFAESFPFNPGEWYFVSLSDWEDQVKDLEDTSDVESEPLTMTDEQYGDIKAFLESDVFMPETKIVDAKTINGKRTRCVETSWDEDKFSDISKYLKDNMDSFDEDSMESLADAIAGFDSLTYTECRDRANDRLYEATLTGKYTLAGDLLDYGSSYGGSGDMVLEFVTITTYSEYDGKFTVDFPEDAGDIVTDYEEWNEEYQNAVENYDYEYDYDYDYDYQY